MRVKAPETYEEKLAQLEEIRHEAIHAGSEAAVAKQHERGKYTARERIEKLLDPGSFQELDNRHAVVWATLGSEAAGSGSEGAGSGCERTGSPSGTAGSGSGTTGSGSGVACAASSLG